MSNSLNWSDLVGSIPDAPPPKPVVPKYSVSTWTDHKCESKHRSGEAFLKCAASWFHNGEKLTKNDRSFSGTGEWAVTHSSYSGDYYTTHNGKRLNHGHIIEDISLFETYEEARDYLTERLNSFCHDKECRGTCRNMSRTIIHVKL